MSDAFNWDDIDNRWQSSKTPEAKEARGDFEEVPDGSYSCVVERAEWRKSKAGKEYLSMALVVDSGPHEGRWIWRRNMLGSQENMTFLKKDLSTCGVAMPERLRDLKLESLLDLMVRATKKTTLKDGREYDNIYLDRLISEVKGDTKKPIAKEYDDDDIPY